MATKTTEYGFSLVDFKLDAPMTTECIDGPYYFEVDDCKDTRKGSDKASGMPLKLGMCIVDSSTGQPHPGAVVDIWNCNAQGIYSGYEDVDPDSPPSRPGDHAPRTPGTWLRGRQTADENGIVEFMTVYPSWYSTRVPHVHLKVWIDGENVLTSQLYFPDEETQILLQQGDYHRPVDPDADMDTDFVRFMMGYDGGAMINLDRDANGYVGRATIVFDPDARSVFVPMSPDVWETIPTHVGTWRANVPRLSEQYEDMKRRGK